MKMLVREIKISVKKRTGKAKNVTTFNTVEFLISAKIKVHSFCTSPPATPS